MTEFTKTYLERYLEAYVEDAQKARAEFADYVTGKNGSIARALDWASGLVLRDEKGKAAAEALRLLADASTPGAVGDRADVLEKKGKAELSYISLGNNQMNVMSRVAYAQALLEMALQVRSFVRTTEKS